MTQSVRRTGIPVAVERIILENRIGRALRQIERWNNVMNDYVSTGQVTLAEFYDEAYYTLVAVRQAISARNFFRETGLDVPTIRNADKWIYRRDLEEHWCDVLRDRPGRPGGNSAPTERCLESLYLHYDRTTIANLRVDEMKTDLKRVYDVVERCVTEQTKAQR